MEAIDLVLSWVMFSLSLLGTAVLAFIVVLLWTLIVSIAMKATLEVDHISKVDHKGWQLFFLIIAGPPGWWWLWKNGLAHWPEEKDGEA